jgi:hypothetical protein
VNNFTPVSNNYFPRVPSSTAVNNVMYSCY